METWLTPGVAVVLMLIGILPALANVYLLSDEWRKPGVLWFLVSMTTGALWAFCFAIATMASSPGVTLAFANFFWTMIPTAAVAMFFLSYEFVFKTTVSRRAVAVAFSPVVLFFLLTWTNPSDLVFTAEYYVDADGTLHFPAFDGIVKVLVTQVYGYLLVFLAAGMFVGEIMRTRGVQRLQALALLVIFSVLVVSTMVKVLEFVPTYYDPTSTVYGLSGVFFAYSINKHGLLRYTSTAREQNFELVDDAIIVVDPSGTVIDVNRAGHQLFGTETVGNPVDEVFSTACSEYATEPIRTVRLRIDGERRYFSMTTSRVDYGRGLEGEIVVLSDVTALKEQENELELLKRVLSRVFRHNIRNDATVINGYATLIEERTDGEVRKWATEITERSNHLVNQSEKARKIEDVITNDDLVEGSIRGAVEKAISLAELDDADVVRSAVEDATVEFHPQFHQAIQELIENAIVHHDADGEPEIVLSTESTDDLLTLVIEDDGPGIPQTEIDTLRAEAETSLEHGSGVGLWLVRWVVTHSNGELTPLRTDNGSRVEIRLSKVPDTTEEGANCDA